MIDPEKYISVKSGKLRDDATSVYSVVRDEMYFMPSFFEHYRNIGIKQFVILDDRSEDGTLEFLLKQPDCVVLASSLRYGDKIEGKRAAHLWKTWIPHLFFGGKWAICADADEFLFIPPQFNGIDQFVASLDRAGVTAVAAVMVDFYPETIGQMEQFGAPKDLSDLFACYPWFDKGPYYVWPPNQLRPKIIHGGVRERLFRKFGISKRDVTKTRLAVLLRRMKTIFVGDRNIGSIHKVPLVKWLPGREYLHSHTLNEAPSGHIVLPLAHFKFTSYLHQKVRQAIQSRAYSSGSRTYFAYEKLLEAMHSGDGSFLCEGSKKFHNVNDFVDAELLKFSETNKC